MLLAIDASTTASGYAFGGPTNGAPRGGTWRLPGAEDHVFDMTLGRAATSVKELCRMIRCEHVAIEAPLFMGEGSNAHTIGALMQLTGALRAVAKMAGCTVSLYGSSSCRKTFIGKGNLKSAAAKAAVMARCDQLGWAYADDNHADANAVWCHAMSLRYPAWAPLSTPLFKGAA